MTAEGSLQSMISVVVPVHNGSNYLSRCLEAILASDCPRYECIVVDDGSTDDSRAIAGRFPVQVLSLGGGPFGPAYARNRGAEVAKGDILFFVDADVVVHLDVLTKIGETFAQHPQVDAVFGSYDESPGAGDFISQYKNLFHHFVHQQGREEAATFWSGCGAVRRKVFLEAGGFDENRYPRPSIEDIDLGCRLRAVGHRILLNKEIQVMHLKRWTLQGMTKCDVLDRGIPWTLLILRRRDLPNDLNLRLSQRVSALLLYVMLLHLAITAFFHNIMILPLLAGLFLIVVGYWQWPGGDSSLKVSWRTVGISLLMLGGIAALALYSNNAAILPPLAPLLLGILAARRLPYASMLWNHVLFATMVVGLAAAFVLVLISFRTWLVAPLLLILCLIVLLNYRFYAFFTRKRGLVFALAVVPFHLLYYFYSVIAFALGASLYIWNTSMRRRFGQGLFSQGGDTGALSRKP